MALKDEVQGEGFAKQLLSLIPSGAELAQEAQRLLMQKYGSLRLDCKLSNVDQILCELLDSEYQLYQKYEQKALSQMVYQALTPECQQNYPAVYQVVRSAMNALNQLATDAYRVSEVVRRIQPVYSLVEQSFAQSRRTRAGGSAQYQVEFILNQLGYNGLYEKQCVLNGTVDFLFPNMNLWQTDRRRCTILSVKRSLRERYKQVYQELGITRGLTIYLMVTEPFEEAKKDISESKIDELNRQNIYLVVRASVKNLYQGNLNVLDFNQFFCKELPRLRPNWTSTS